MRELTAAELDLISGGLGGSEDYSNEDIVVTGSPYPPPYYPWYPPVHGPSPYYPGTPSTPPGSGPPYTPPADNASVDVDTSRLGVLDSPEKMAALSNFFQTVRAITAAVNALPANTHITLSDGKIVYSNEIKSAWAVTDFRVDPSGTDYGGGNKNSQADWGSGNPQVNVNIDLLVGYNASPGGLNYFALHELSHFAAVARADNAARWADGSLSAGEIQYHERMGNDIARAIAETTRTSILSNPGYEYTPGPALVFKP